MIMKYLLVLIVTFISLNQNAIATELSDANFHYMKNLKGASEGIIESAGITYFIEDVSCLKDKKYAGSKESKYARKLIDISLVELLAQSINKTDFSLSYPKNIASALDKQHRKNQASLTMSHTLELQLVIDKNIDNCTRRVVIAARTKDIKNKQQIQKQKVDEELLFIQTLESSFNTKNHQQLSAIYEELNNPILSLIFLINSDENTPTFDNNLNWLSIESDLLKKQKLCNLNEFDKNKSPSVIALNNICNNTKQAVLEMITPETDTKSELSTAIHIIDKSLGVIKFKPMKQNITASKVLSDKATELFEQGINPHDIINLLSISLNLNPHQVAQWNQIGTVFKALGQNKLALSCHIQSMIQNPQNLDSWLHLIKTLRALELNEHAITIEKQLIQAATFLPHSAWVKKHIKTMK